jgi:toxin ParE1/3/4
VTRRTLQISPFASDDILQIIEYLIESEGMRVANTADAQIDAAIASLEYFAERGRVVPELRHRGILQFRELVVAPYRIVYRVHERDVWVVLVFDRRREPINLLTSRVRERG